MCWCAVKKLLTHSRHLIRDFLDSPKSISQTACRSVQPFLNGWRPWQANRPRYAVGKKGRSTEMRPSEQREAQNGTVRRDDSSSAAAKLYHATRAQQLRRWAIVTQQSGPKNGGGLLCPFRGRMSWVPNVAWAEAYLRTKWHLDPSSRLATRDMGRKLVEGVPLFGEGVGSPCNTTMASSCLVTIHQRNRQDRQTTVQ